MRHVWTFLLLFIAGCAQTPQDTPPPSLLSAEAPAQTPATPKLALDGWSGCMVRDRATLQLYVELRDTAGQVYMFRVLDDGTLRYAPDAYIKPSRERVRPRVRPQADWDRLEVSF